MALKSWKVLAEVHTVESCRNMPTKYLAKKMTISKPYVKRFGHNTVYLISSFAAFPHYNRNWFLIYSIR